MDCDIIEESTQNAFMCACTFSTPFAASVCKARLPEFHALRAAQTAPPTHTPPDGAAVNSVDPILTATA